MPKVTGPRTLFLIRLESGKYYWEPRPDPDWNQYDGPDRSCSSQRAAKKFESISHADRFATVAGLRGYEVVPYDRV